MKRMHVERIVVFVEEPSAEAMLRTLLPRLVGNIPFEIHTYLCKQDLLATLPIRLEGYRSWIPESWRIVVLVDCDDDDCRELKQRLEKVARTSGMSTRSTRHGIKYSVVNRIAVEELEAWYFGDWNAVRRAYPRVSESIPRRARYRTEILTQSRGGLGRRFNGSCRGRATSRLD